MAKHDKILERIRGGMGDANIPFDDLCSMLAHFDFTMRVKSSHRIFTRAGVAEIINLQPGTAGKAKVYQVRQVRTIFEKYRIQ